MVSPSAVEALKLFWKNQPITASVLLQQQPFEEYDEWISPNRALDQRLLPDNYFQNYQKKRLLIYLSLVLSNIMFLELADEAVFGEIYDLSRRILISNYNFVLQLIFYLTVSVILRKWSI